jgi:hypothetical protein
MAPAAESAATHMAAATESAAPHMAPAAPTTTHVPTTTATAATARKRICAQSAR